MPLAPIVLKRTLLLVDFLTDRQWFGLAVALYFASAERAGTALLDLSAQSVVLEGLKIQLISFPKSEKFGPLCQGNFATTTAWS